MWWKELLFTGFYSGYSPFAPGTAATLLAVLFYIIEYIIFGAAAWISNLILVIVMIYPAIKIADAGEIFFNEKDPKQVVLDEMIGYWISILFFPFSWGIVICAFFLFRMIDILKPFPIKQMERYKGGLGIIMDDLVSGICTNLILRIILFFTGLFNLYIY